MWWQLAWLGLRLERFIKGKRSPPPHISHSSHQQCHQCWPVKREKKGNKKITQYILYFLVSLIKNLRKHLLSNFLSKVWSGLVGSVRIWSGLVAGGVCSQGWEWEGREINTLPPLSLVSFKASTALTPVDFFCSCWKCMQVFFFLKNSLERKTSFWRNPSLQKNCQCKNFLE